MEKHDIKDLTVNELLALMPKKQADKILKSRNPKVLDEGPILKTGRPGRAHIPEGSFDEGEVDSRRQLAKERRAAAKRRQKAEKTGAGGGWRDLRGRPKPYNPEAQHLKKPSEGPPHPRRHFEAPQYSGVKWTKVSSSKDGKSAIWKPSKPAITGGPLIKTDEDGLVYYGSEKKGWTETGRTSAAGGNAPPSSLRGKKSK